MTPTIRHLAAAACLAVALVVPPAFAVGGGTPDPTDVPVLQALRTQVAGLDQDFVFVTGIVEPQDLPVVRQLADELARMDAQLAVAAVGGGSPDPSQTTLNTTLLALRAATVSLRNHVDAVTGKVRENPNFKEIARVLFWMQSATRMTIARIDYALPAALVPTTP